MLFADYRPGAMTRMMWQTLAWTAWSAALAPVALLTPSGSEDAEIVAFPAERAARHHAAGRGAAAAEIIQLRP